MVRSLPPRAPLVSKATKAKAAKAPAKAPAEREIAPAPAAQHHDRHRAGGGPGGDAEDVGFREGIFQQALQHDAADSEACAAAGGDQARG